MYLTDADKHTAYENTADVFTHSGPCPQCGEDAPCY